MSDHVHDCTGPDMRCSCGYVFTVPPICVSFEVTDKDRVLVSDGFNCSDVSVAIRAFQRAIDKLEGIERQIALSRVEKQSTDLARGRSLG